jgi:hypothetical protein
MNKLVIDIETGALPEPILRGLCPAFNPDEVKLGNTKDPDKVAAKIAEAEASHFTDFSAKAALDARYGQVLAFGFMNFTAETFSVGEQILHEAPITESQVVEFGLELIADTLTTKFVVGFNIKAFDLPFLIRRAWHHGVKVPKGIFTTWKGRVQWHDNFIDLRDVWQLGDRMAHGNLDSICQHLGAGMKSGSGANFASLFASDREAALAYLKNDLEITANVASRML